MDLLLQPPGMTRRQANSTCFHGHWHSLAWHLEWRFPAADGLVLHSRCAPWRIPQHCTAPLRQHLLSWHMLSAR